MVMQDFLIKHIAGMQDRRPPGAQRFQNVILLNDTHDPVLEGERRLFADPELVEHDVQFMVRQTTHKKGDKAVDEALMMEAEANKLQAYPVGPSADNLINYLTFGGGDGEHFFHTNNLHPIMVFLCINNVVQ